MRLRLLSLLAAVSLFSAVGSVARADIVTALSGSPVAVNGGYQYTYNVSLSVGQLDPVVNGNPVQFGTLYDFGASTFVGATGLLSTDFSFTFNNSDTSAYLTNPNDDPNLMNVRFTYTGGNGVYVLGQSTTLDPLTATSVAGTGGNLGTFTLMSAYGTTRSVNYDGQTYKGTNDTEQGNVGSSSAPDPLGGSAVTPEPSSLLLLGTGLLGTAVLFRRRFLSAAAPANLA